MRINQDLFALIAQSEARGEEVDPEEQNAEGDDVVETAEVTVQHEPSETEAASDMECDSARHLAATGAEHPSGSLPMSMSPRYV